ncbi:MAG: LysE/ArgO family amino acid transporter [Pseudomonadota bacterium]|nr:LysE/ArgO family amino acid transporter [Pseudomonadota bacterium]
MSVLAAYGKGLAVMAALIIAIGVQNAFVLRQGLKRQSAFIAAGICFLCDGLLVGLGAVGLGALFAESRLLSASVSIGGAAFLLFYGLRSLHAAKTTKGLDLTAADKVSRTSVIMTALAVSLLNPHVYIDTVMLVGGLAAHYEGIERVACALGAMTISALWFYGLAHGARWLAPVLTKPKIWRSIDLVIGFMMLGLAAGLVRDGISHWRGA